MATKAADPVTEPFTPRPLWQAPLFLLGVAAAVGAWVGRPLFPPTPERMTQRDLHNVRQILDKPDGDVEWALKLATRAVAASEKMPVFAGEAAFLAGSAHLRLAGKGGANAADNAMKARLLLDQADQDGVVENDRTRLEHRRAMAGLNTGMDPRKIAELLESAAKNPADDRAESYAVLTRVYRGMTPPDLGKAVEANNRLRDLPDLSEADAHQAKLQGAELQLRLNDPDKARLALKGIDDRAPVEVVQRARLLRARTYQEEKPPKWQEAALEYDKALADGRVPADAALARYNLGLCFRNLGRPEEAARAWQQCVETAKGPEGTAAAAALVEVYLGGPDPAPDKAMDALTRAVAGYKPGAAWKNPLLTEPQLLDLFERARRAFAQAERPDLLYKLAAEEGKTTAAPRALVLRAEAAAAWGLALKKAGKPADQSRSVELLVEAGEAFQKAADEPGLKPEDRAERLFQAGTSFLAGDDKKRGGAALFAMRSLDGTPERMGEAHYLLGEIYRENPEDKKKAQEMYTDCLKYNTRFASLARHRRAMALLEDGDLDGAEAALVSNSRELSWATDPEANAESLIELTKLLYGKRNWDRVVYYLERGLARLRESPAYKDKEPVSLMRLQLADSYRQIAARELLHLRTDALQSKEKQAHHESQRRLYLQKAADEFVSLDAFLESEAGKTHLAEKRRSVGINAAKCLFDLGEYDEPKYKEAVGMADRLVERYKGSIEEIDALGLAVQCDVVLKQLANVQQRLIQIDLALENKEIPGDVRANWKKWAEDTRGILKAIKEKK